MTLLVAWLLFPLVLGLLSLGCGLLVQCASGIRLPSPLVLPVGLAVVSLTAQFAIMRSSTAQLATPAVLAFAIAGFGLSLPWRRPRLDPWPAAAAGGVYCVFAAPVVLSGRATFAGYMKLDDIASFLAMLDRAMQHGYSIAGLAPASYQASLRATLAHDYPLGSMLPLGVARPLVGEDLAWLWQPYLSFLAAMIALGLYQVVSGLVRSGRLRAVVAFVGAQAALLYGYALWGGVKEIGAAVMIVPLAALAPQAAQSREGPRALLPLAIVTATLLGVLSVGGTPWLAAPLAAALVLAALTSGLLGMARKAVAFALLAALLSLPAISAAGTWLKHSSATTSAGEHGNLVHPLSVLQAFGIWPSGDFRSTPRNLQATHVLIAVAALGAVAALVAAWRRRAWELPIAVATAAFGCAVYVRVGSPWVGAKALASASPILLAAGIAGAATIFETGRRVEAAVVAVVVIPAVLWSNALQYHDVYLAPSGRLAELATIGDRFSGQGPALMTEYDTYGARHFLRSMAAEGAGELRRHFVYLRTGGFAEIGVSPDIDEIQLESVLVYPTLVLRRSAVASRPPSVYQPVSSGRYYEVWQRPARSAGTILEHLSLGSRLQPATVPPCAEVLRLARLAATHQGLLATVDRPQAIVIQPDGAVGAPTSFGPYGETAKVIHPTGTTILSLPFSAPAAGTYGIWIGGSFRARVTAWVDGTRTGSASGELTWPGNFFSLGSVRLDAGRHVLRVRYSGPGLGPGSADVQFGLGPFALAQGTGDRPVRYVEPSAARALCGKSLDWLEAVPG